MSRTDEATRWIDAPAARVYAAFVSPEILVRWLPPDGMSARIEHFDPRAGGGYRIVLTYRDASDAPGKSSAADDVVEGRFVDVVEGVRVVQEVEFVSDDPAYSGTMRMTWEVVPEGSGSRVAFRADDVPSGISAADHQEGFASSLQNLAVAVEGADQE